MSLRTILQATLVGRGQAACEMHLFGASKPAAKLFDMGQTSPVKLPQGIGRLFLMQLQ